MMSPQQSVPPCWARVCRWLLTLCALVSAALAQNNPPPAIFLGLNAGAAFFPETGRGTLLLASDINTTVDFRPAANGQFLAPVTLLDGRMFTVVGTLTGDNLVGSVPALNVSFSATLQPQTGSLASLAGLYLPSSSDELRGVGLLVTALGQGIGVAQLPRLSTAAGGRFVVEAATLRTSFSSSALRVQGSFNAASGIFNGAAYPTGTTFLVPFRCISSTTPRTDRVINVSARGPISAATSRTLIAGFVVDGQSEKRILLRALGPGLFGRDPRGAVIANPRLRLFDSSNRLLAENDDWSGDELIAVFAQVGAFPLTTGSRDAALVTTLRPGIYTLQVSGESGTGDALAEIYDIEAHTAQARPRQIINGSALGTLDSPQATLRSGFVIVGNRAKKLLIRAVGPSLEAFGVRDASADPALSVSPGGRNAASNDNWSTPQGVLIAATGPEIAAAAREVGAFPLTADSKDAALIVTLDPGDYVARVTGTTGTVLIEVYELP